MAGAFSGIAAFDSISLTNNGSGHFMAKYNNAGNVVWAQKLSGGPDDGTGVMAADAAGNSYVTGWFAGTATFGSRIPYL